MTTRRVIIIASGCLLLLASIGLVIFREKRLVDDSHTKATLYLNWIFTATFSGDILAAERYAHDYELSIHLEAGGEGRDPIKLVRDDEFGVASSDEIIRAIDKGVHIVIIGVLNDTHPAAFAALSQSGITTPKDFEGKRVGVLPFGATGLIYSALCDAAGVDRHKVQEVVITPDLRPFLAGTVNDVQPIFIYDEPVTFDQRAIKYNVIDPKQYGVNFKGQAYFTTRHTVTHNNALVKKFLGAIVDGWAATAMNPETAIAALKRLSPSSDSVRERELLRRGIGFFVASGHQILATDPSTWSGMLDTLVKTKTISKPMNTSVFLSMEPLQQMYAERH